MLVRGATPSTVDIDWDLPEEWLEQGVSDPLQRAFGRASVEHLDTAVLNGGVGVEHSASTASIDRAAMEVFCEPLTRTCENRTQAVGRILEPGKRCARVLFAEGNDDSRDPERPECLQQHGEASSGSEWQRGELLTRMRRLINTFKSLYARGLSRTNSPWTSLRRHSMQ